MHVLPSRQKAFPFEEGVGSADGRGYCLPPLGKVSALPTEEVIAFPFSGKVSALPTEEVCTVESVPPRRTLCKFLLDLGEMPSPRDVVIN